MDPLNKQRFYIVIYLAVALLAGAACVVIWSFGRFGHRNLVLIGLMVLIVSLFFSMSQLGLYLTFRARMKEKKDKDIPTFNPYRDADTDGVPGGDEQEEEVEPPDTYDEGLMPPGRKGTAASPYWCPKCGSGDVIVEDEGPSPVGSGGVLPLDRLKRLARSAGSAWGLRLCRGCGHRW